MARPIQMNPVTGAMDEPEPPAGRTYGTPPASAPVPIDDYMRSKQGAMPLEGPAGRTGAGSAPPIDVNSDVDTMGADQVGDIPPPPIPDAPAPLIQGPGVAGIRGTEAGTFARPGSAGAAPFRSPAFVPKRPPRFGPGVANVGGGQPALDGGVGLSPDEAAELLAGLAGGRGGF